MIFFLLFKIMLLSKYKNIEIRERLCNLEYLVVVEQIWEFKLSGCDTIFTIKSNAPLKVLEESAMITSSSYSKNTRMECMLYLTYVVDKIKQSGDYLIQSYDCDRDD